METPQYQLSKKLNKKHTLAWEQIIKRNREIALTNYSILHWIIYNLNGNQSE